MLTKAQEAARQGDFAKAYQLLAAQAELTRPEAQVLDLCGLYAWNCGNFAAALACFSRRTELYGDTLQALQNKLSCLCKLKKHDEAEPLALALLRHPHCKDVADIYTVLTIIAAERHDHDAAVRYGALTLLHRDVAGGENLPAPASLDLPTRKKFNPETPLKNIISFSLWGKQARYLRGAVRNALLALDLYPSWTCRFYVEESVPKDVRELLTELGAQVLLMPQAATAYEGLGWRFQVWDDPEVDFCLVRDCDSVISPFEVRAVHDWLATDRWFHLMRCWYTHTDLILAGLWGGAVGALRSVFAQYQSFARQQAATGTATVDQEFLRKAVWPLIKQHAVMHDRYGRMPGTVPFPDAHLLPARWHVGCNETAAEGARQELCLKHYYDRAPSLQRSRQISVRVPAAGRVQLT